MPLPLRPAPTRLTGPRPAPGPSAWPSPACPADSRTCAERASRAPGRWATTRAAVVEHDVPVAPRTADYAGEPRLARPGAALDQRTTGKPASASGSGASASLGCSHDVTPIFYSFRRCHGLEHRRDHTEGETPGPGASVCPAGLDVSSTVAVVGDRGCSSARRRSAARLPSTRGGPLGGGIYPPADRGELGEVGSVEGERAA